ncbi:unnamed protein product [Rhizoctonia solani]|uniref:Uncharacterized protein n=1 Tax=Rhizoctonia solani TaxID=456999 RepID=A0A8H3DUU5_9AGAM|nr:unnamed protein product [Rhizoctonia solani]
MSAASPLSMGRDINRACSLRRLTLSVSSSAEITDVDNFRVAATVSNTGSETLRLLRDPRSPLSTYATETFGVVNNKETRAQFSGIKARCWPSRVVC